MNRSKNEIGNTSSYSRWNMPVPVLLMVSMLLVMVGFKRTEDSSQEAISKSSLPDGQYYSNVKTKFDVADSPEQQAQLMQSHLNAYPRGKHRGDATALLENAQLGKTDAIQHDESMKRACIANLRQIEGAVEQCKLGGIDNPTLDQVYEHIRHPPHCPLDETKEYIIKSGSPVCPNNGREHIWDGKTAPQSPVLTVPPPPILTTGDYAYTTNRHGQAEIISFNRFYFGALSVTNELSGCPVTAIADEAFSGRSGLTAITLPVSITSIGDGAFSYCTGLTAITLPVSITSIGDGAFSYCTGLTAITLPVGVTRIGDEVFQGCGLASITLPVGVTHIGNEAFQGCNLASITLPAGVTNIEYSAFSNCEGLTSILVDDANATYSSVDGVLFCKDQTVLLQCPEGKTGSYTLPVGVTHIGDRAFSGCTGLTAITIPGSVTTIGGYAFTSCTGLTAITIPSSVTTIGVCTFTGCTGLTAITIPASVTTIGECAFTGCSGLTAITLPVGVTHIGDRAFMQCTGLTAITLPVGVTHIGDGAFWGCSDLTSITLPVGVTHIGARAFSGCTDLTSITIPAGVTHIVDGAFSGCTGLTAITIPGSVTTIGDYAFYGCSGLNFITLPAGVTTLGGAAFYGCSGLTAVYFEGDAPVIGRNVFQGAPNATVYYRLGTTGWGWGKTFGGRPTMAWDGTTSPAPETAPKKATVEGP